MYLSKILACGFLSLACSCYAFEVPQSRRAFTKEAISIGITSTLFPSISNAKGELPTDKQDISYLAYEVIPDAAKLSPSIKQIDAKKFVKQSIFQNRKKQQGGVVWLGEHHNSQKDHLLQAYFIENLYKQRGNKQKMSIGLEQIQIQFQPVLDAFVDGKITEEEMLEQCQWSTRWTWPYENYRPVFQLARDLKIPLIALNVNSEDLAKVEVDGLQGLPISTMKKYIKNPILFSNFVSSTAFKAYSAYVIEPSYDLHKEMGILRTTIAGQQLEEDMTFRNFLSGRILWDESMAGNAYQWTKENEGGLMIGLIGADHVKFNKGVVGRYQRLVENYQQKENKPFGDSINTSILLNPTLIDTRPSGTADAYMNAYSSQFPDQLTLQLRYLKDGILPSSPDRALPSSTGGVLPLADYIVVSA